jgi:uncharacterized delta-60 repeat protein
VEGVLDTSFGVGGVVSPPFVPPGAFAGWDVGSAVSLQSDGKILVAGHSGGILIPSDFVLARYDNSGTLDPGFGGLGYVTTDFGGDEYANALALQPDGKIVVAGRTNDAGKDFALARYLTDGSLDPRFGSGGKVTTHIGPPDSIAGANGVAVDADGAIVAAGTFYPSSISPSASAFAVAKYKQSGNLVPGFAKGGLLVDQFVMGGAEGNALAVQPDGRIIVAGMARIGAGYQFAMARYLKDGRRDVDFGNHGRVMTAFGRVAIATAIALQPDQRIVVAGRAIFGNVQVIALARYNADGNLDTSFGSGGRVLSRCERDQEGFAVAVQRDGRIVVAGHVDLAGSGAYHFNVRRFMKTGLLDGAFGDRCGAFTPVGLYDEARGVAIQPDGAIVAAGVVDDGLNVAFALARYV